MASDDDLSPSLKSLCDSVLQRHSPTLEHVLLSNLYGLPIIRASALHASIPPDPLETIFATLFAMTAEQLEKLTSITSSSSSTSSSSKAKWVLAEHEGHILIQAALHPLVLALVATKDADIGALVAEIPSLQASLENVRIAAEKLTT